ncbi:DUF7662 domain-containing protein [Pseudactinotalea terrae]|uniref:DUF7662 domain-containing protein n=1 Tax=Pseudactinotalea terrae TaxID=1743262 RepID=UPI0012E1AFE2|nr:hypothetical protein [Pseudactinotalea terrae]
MANWQPLRDRLEGVQGSITLGWDEIDRLVGGLPPSAFEHTAFWGGSRPAWAGFRTREVRVGGEVTFVRTPPTPGGATTDDRRSPGSFAAASEIRWVGTREGQAIWADVALAVLIGVASHYGGVISYSDLGEHVQERSGLRTRVPLRNWIGGMLAEVVHRCHREGLPPLTSLVVHKHDGQVGVGYDEVLTVQGIAPTDDQLERETYAAEGRLACYRRWANDVPANATATLTAKFERSVQSRRRRSATPAPPAVCPTCSIQLPASGVCDDCS